ncbi:MULTISPECIES: AAA family ATPase [Bacillaceae]|uniref:AAA family ATPase n=1 Tax=Evansella alkalicola TaxID=745819 RepID=A0ABS6K069_9BACI|nr:MULTISPECIES: AAA family ATPase [Bacillaceae]MBU9724247.1 AAA family ATPase [Bacillus alkalicola]
MKKISLIVADHDTSYIEMLANYIRTSSFSSKLEMKLFSKKEALQQYIETGERINVLLAAPEFIPEGEDDELNKLDHVDTIIGLDEQGEELEGAIPVIFKYQQLTQLLNQVTSIFYERKGKSPKKTVSNDQTKVISTFSATGGTGKSTVAFNLAKEIAALDYSVFYLNLELLNTTYVFMEDDRDNASSPILYYVKTGSDQLPQKIEELKQYDSETGVELFRLTPSAEEMSDLTEEETDRLIKAIVNTKNYDYIIIDLESTLNPRTKAALQKSSHVLWLLNNDIQSFTKTSFFIEELHSLLSDADFSEKVSFVLNKYMGKVEEAFKDEEIAIEAYLPYVPEWKVVKSGNDLITSPVFSEFIIKMFRDLLQSSNSNRGVANV